MTGFELYKAILFFFNFALDIDCVCLLESTR